MEIENANSATLCNLEVFRHLQKIKNSKMKHRGQLATITYETIRYLENTPCGNQTNESVTECMKALSPFNLNKTEMLMMINSPPITALEIQLIVEESEERLTEEQVQEILQIISRYFPHVIKEQNEEDEDSPE